MLKLGLLGAGFMGKLHAACYPHVKEAQLVKVADVDLPRAQEIAKTYNISATQDPDEIITDLRSTSSTCAYPHIYTLNMW